jgi:chromosomal replication initiator protein
VDVAREELRDKLRGGDHTADGSLPSLSVTSIQQAVARDWGVTPEGLRSKTRTKILTLPRQIAMFLTRELLGTQLMEIGNAFGGRDHSTVIHSIEKITTAVHADPLFKTRVDKVRLLLEASRS